MKITFVLPTPTLNGGVRVVAIYAGKLQDRGHDVRVVFSARRHDTLRARMRRLVRGQWGPDPRTAGLTYFENLGIPRQVVDPDLDLENEIPDSDVVVATWWRTALLVNALSPRKGAKAYFLQHYETHAGLPIERVKETWALPLHKIVVHRWLAEVAADEYGDHDVSVAPNSVDTDLFFAPPRGKQPVPTVGMMYSETPFKGCDTALRAVELARRTVPELRLVAFGAHPPGESLPLPPGTHFECRPPQPRIRELYAQCDAWLFSSRSEGFGLPILEAMACRTPVIGTPTGTAPDHLDEGRGILVPIDDAEAMADAIVRMARMPEPEWRAMSDAAHAKVTSYTWDDAADLFEAGLHRAREKHRAASRV